VAVAHVVSHCVRLVVSYRRQIQVYLAPDLDFVSRCKLGVWDTLLVCVIGMGAVRCEGRNTEGRSICT
jgi:hypothetical protein